MKYWWRVTRYDPAKRDERGAYRGETWTSISDVGRRYDDSELSLDEYLKVEDAYVNSFAAFAEESGVDCVEVRGLGYGTGLREGDVLTIAAAREIVRRMLREDASCKLEEPGDRFALHVGYDLYMYVGSERPCTRAVQFAQASGLYIDEDFPSPQLPDEE